MFAKMLESEDLPEPFKIDKNHNVIIEKYFQRLSNDDIRGLVDLYKLDFKMFNYSFTFRNKTFITPPRRRRGGG